ncbi:GNAT family N-acetyltransferase [Kineococcus sp. GCM10028916]|uniref:GNAT family N-acetyltransferase n=1 Tax=Kineococcus sp. GCM10028916 TaxID=3273394 RepID=UPI00362841DD
MHWRAARLADGPAIAELRVDVLRESLERVGRFDPTRARAYFLGSFAPEFTRVLDGPEGIVGSIAVRPSPEGTWIEHFYLARDLQGTGQGGAVLADVTAAADRTGTTLLLDVLVGSDARRLYERHGFVEDHTDGVDVIMVRPPR